MASAFLFARRLIWRSSALARIHRYLPAPRDSTQLSTSISPDFAPAPSAAL